MANTTSMSLTEAQHTMLSLLSAKTSKSATLRRLVQSNQSAKLTPQHTKRVTTSFVLDQGVLESLDTLVQLNGLRSRNEAVGLLIEQAYKQADRLGETPASPQQDLF